MNTVTQQHMFLCNTKTWPVHVSIFYFFYFSSTVQVSKPLYPPKCQSVLLFCIPQRPSFPGGIHSYTERIVCFEENPIFYKSHYAKKQQWHKMMIGRSDKQNAGSKGALNTCMFNSQCLNVVLLFIYS